LPKSQIRSAARAELRSAQAADDEAKKQALQKGLVATKPLTAVRLAELCLLGETMVRTARRKQAALASVIRAEAS